MSRCFPFPPPGYEKKPRLEDTNALKEEKKKEKKHKKEKKDREKREDKEKRDKDRSDGKHREKRDRKEKHKKEKHKDKKKDKEKDKSKDKEKGSNSETSGVASIPGTKSTDNLGSEDEKNKIFSSNEKTNASIFHYQNGEKSIPSNLLSQDMEESRFVQELARRIKDEEKVSADPLERFSGAENKKDDDGERIPVQNPGNFVADKGKGKNRQIHDKKMDGTGNADEVNFDKNSVAHSFAGTGKSNSAELAQAVEENEKRMEAKEKAKEKDNKTRNKHKDKDGEKKSHRKNKDEEKEKKKAEKAKEKKKDKNTEPGKSKSVNQNDFLGRKNGPDNSSNASRSQLLGFTEVMGSVPLSDHRNHAIIEGNEKKRKEIDINGFLYDNEVRPTKLLRPGPHQLLENGRKLEAHQPPILLSSDKLRHMQESSLSPNPKVDNKEQKKNGLVDIKPVSILGPNPSVLSHQVIEKPRKPHPDTKFLSQILMVPKMDEWSEFDDQEWLFDSQDPPSRKHEVGSAGVHDDLQVWSKALNIESTDIIALPYVLPY